MLARARRLAELGIDSDDSMPATIILGVVAVVGVAVGSMVRQRREAKKKGERLV
ncbi:hypothetical protein ACGF5T_17915 [Streptomyces sp. NPDC047853]|uniref:hypothetical protein n=1 Tax=unclassified Streptomyces TaxID=2593676 RepID=UPI0034547CE8